MKKLFQKLSLFFATTLAALMITAPLTAPAVYAAPKDDICTGVDAVTGTSGCGTPSKGHDVNDTLKLAINIISAIVGVIAVIMVIIGGLKYIMSQGDSTQVNSAKNTILYAVIGMLVVVLAQTIVHFVLSKV